MFKLFIGYKGNKFAATSEPFGYPSEDMLPEHYQKYLVSVKKQSDEYFFRPSKFGKTSYDIKMDKF